MKIIHTADWHIGKVLHKQELHEEISLFFDWLISHIEIHNIDVLLVSGDIFDLANPSHKDTKLYYDTLTRLSQTKTKVIITGGNHDSISLINAPADLLKSLNIDVLGGVPDDFEKQIIPIYNIEGKLSALVLAVPFLRDKDLRKSQKADEAADKSIIVQSAIKTHYDTLVKLARNKYAPHVPIIAMGHLFMHGALTSDSERDIHVGNLQGIELKVLDDEIIYVALGHIHKPQMVSKKEHVRYSGSPVHLDFSESGYQKMIIEIEIIPDHPISVKPIHIPKFRELLRIQGQLTDIQNTLDSYKNQCPLITYVEVEISEPSYQLTIDYDFQQLSNMSTDNYKVIKSRISYNDRDANLLNLFYSEKSIDEMTPLQILNNRLEGELMDESQKIDIREVYVNIIENLNN